MPDASRFAWLAARGVILAVAIGMPSIARAVNYTWDASGGAPLNDGGGTWSSSGGTNWLNANTSTYGAWGNTTSDVAFFGVGSGAAGTVNVSGTVTTNGITFNSAGSGNYTLTGGTISIGGSSPTIAVNAAGTSTIASALTASSGFTKTGAGDLVTSGVITTAGSFNNNGTGTWEISGGFVKTGAMTLQTNAGMGGILVSGSIAGTSNSVNLNGTGSGTVSGPIITAFAINKNGTGTWVVSGSSSFTGNTNVTAGVLNVRNSWGFGTQDRTTTVSAGATLELQDGITFTAFGMGLAGEGVGNGGALRNVSGTNTYNGQVTMSQAARINSDAGTLTIGSTGGSDIRGGSLASYNMSFGGAGNVVIATIINTGTGNLTKDGAGTLTLSAANTYTGTTAVNAGTLRIGNAGTTGALSGSSAITGSSGAVLAFNRTDGYGGNFSNTIGGGLGLRLSSGTLTLTGSNSYTGGSTISLGRLVLGNLNALGTGTATVNGGELAIGSYAPTVAGFTISSGSLTGSGTLTATNGYALQGGAVSANLGTGTLSVGGNTTLTGTAAAGTVNIDSGTFTLSSGGLLASTAAVNATAIGATLDISGLSGSGLTIGSLSGSAGSIVTLGGKTLTFGDGNATAFAGAIGGAGGITKQGAGVATLSGSNGFSGATTINAGVLNVGSANALAGGGTMSFGGGTLQYSAANTNDFSGRFSTAASQAYRIDTNGQNVSFANPLVSTNGSLVKTGGGTLTLANSSTTASSLGLLRADGGVLTLASGRVDVSGTNSQMFATNGGSLTVTGGTMNAGSVFWQPIIGQGSTGSLTVSGGRFISGTVGGMMIGNGASGTVTVSGSGVFESASPVAFLIGRDGGTGVLNLNGGTIETSGTLQGSDFNGATGTLNLAGGTLKSRNASNANWISSGVGTLNVRVGGSDAVANSGAVFDTNGYTMGIGLNLTTSATGSAIDGGLVLNDTAATKGTLMLSGSNSYNGLTRLIAGTLDFNSINALRNSSGVSIAGGAGLRYSGGAASFDRNITVTSGTGTVANSGGGLLTLAGTLTKNGTILRLTGGQFNVTGQIVGSSSNSDLVVDGTSTVTLSSANTYNGPTFVNQASNLIVNINNAIPSGSIITLGDATTSGTLSLGSFSDAIGGLSFGAGGGTLRMAAASTSSAPLTASAGTVNLNNGTLDLTGSGTSAGLYRLISAQTVAGTLSSVTGASAAYQVVTTSSSVNYQQRAVLGAVSVTNPAAAIITGGSAAFTYTVANNALSGGADLAFSSGSPLNIAGTSSGTAAAGGSSSSVSGLVFTGTSVGAGRNGTFAVNALSAYGSTTASGTVSVDVYNHASGSATGATIALADSIVGYTGSLVGLTSATISNAAGYRVNLMTTGGTSAGFVNINNVSGVAAGSSGQISAAAGLDGSQTVGANSLGQTFNLTYADDSNLNGASNNLGSQAITVTGRVLDHATSSLGASLLTSTTVSLGTYNYSTNTWESGGATGFFDIYNLASAFGASLTADLSLVNAIGAGNGFTTNLLSTYADIAGNGSQRFSIFFDPSGAQANRSTTFTISMRDKTGMAGATASNTLFVTANVIVVPEPGSIVLAGLGIGLAGWMALRRRKSP